MVEITVALYLAGTVNHATMNERVKITDYRRVGGCNFRAEAKPRKYQSLIY